MKKESDNPYTKTGGFYYRAYAFHWAMVALAFIPALLLIILALFNPFWFREQFFRWINTTVNRYSAWRNYKMYSIYLGTDAKLWTTLKE